MRNMRSESGYTFIEILIVAAIIGLLATLVGKPLFEKFVTSKVKLARTQLESLEQSVKMFRLDTGRLPTAGEGLRALVPPPPTNVRGFAPEGYLEDEEIPVDPWDNPYQYQSDGRHFLLVSLGPDGIPSDDDITNRAEKRRFD